MNFIDTHCHLLFSNYDDDREEVLKKVNKELDLFIEIGGDLDNSKKVVEFVKNQPKAFGSVGIHPSDSEGVDNKDLEELEKLAQSEKIVAVGETGLDFYWETNKQTQYKIFDAQVSIAKKLNKPIVLHIRDAYNEAYEFLKKSNLPSKLGVVHCFSDTWETAKKFLDLGFYIGIDGPITYSKNSELRKVVQQAPLDRILPETDSPFLPPVPFRGKRNMPVYVKYIYEKIAEIKNIDIEELKKQMYFNARTLFF
ncbi:MAG TPA: TatD family hydrolase [Defluviitoga sp.]|nr:TatD family hydrolase [Defluviitoga sp.]HOP24911.1 TatD family hydrolase [Defluviitoga sp.]HPU59956.1 TatD family hydrolase [Defluviitoga tunisiensis]HPZ29220.1 TatD family hydrolase [Defluviitoga sp.]HQD63175.1 TatD family hydrolase [Defluviitoga sp.]